METARSYQNYVTLCEGTLPQAVQECLKRPLARVDGQGQLVAAGHIPAGKAYAFAGGVASSDRRGLHEVFPNRWDETDDEYSAKFPDERNPYQGARTGDSVSSAALELLLQAKPRAFLRRHRRDEALANARVTKVGRRVFLFETTRPCAVGEQLRLTRGASFWLQLAAARRPLNGETPTFPAAWAALECLMDHPDAPRQLPYWLALQGCDLCLGRGVDGEAVLGLLDSDGQLLAREVRRAEPRAEEKVLFQADEIAAHLERERAGLDAAAVEEARSLVWNLLRTAAALQTWGPWSDYEVAGALAARLATFADVCCLPGALPAWLAESYVRHPAATLCAVRPRDE